jgi:murein hydrolase activator
MVKVWPKIIRLLLPLYMGNGFCKFDSLYAGIRIAGILFRRSLIFCAFLSAAIFSISLFSFSIGSGKSWAQQKQLSKQGLERQKRENEARMQKANKILADVAQKKEATLGQLNALKEQISSRLQLINGIRAEVEQLDRDLNIKLAQTKGLLDNLSDLKAEYAGMVYRASKISAADTWLFVFAADDFNQFFARLTSLRHYAEERRSQAKRIEAARSTLVKQRNKLQFERDKKATLLASYTQEKQKLGQAQQAQGQLIDRLSRKESDLRAEVARREEADRKLERLISDMLRREMRKAEEARRRADREERARSRNRTGERENAEERVEESERETSREAIPASAESIRLSNSFVENKGRLGWPVDAGFISGRYGRQAHPILRGVIVENLGINLQTKGGEKVYAVSGGEIGFVADIPGVNGRIVSIMHGDYFTVYSNMGSVSVRPGEKVKARQQIGAVSTDRDGVSELQFQVWKGDQRLNPEIWLRKE